MSDGPSVNPADIQQLLLEADAPRPTSSSGLENNTTDAGRQPKTKKNLMCPLSTLFASLARSSEDKKRLGKVDPLWMNIALKADKQSNASRALRMLAKKRKRESEKKTAVSAISAEERHLSTKAAERMAHRVGVAMESISSSPKNPTSKPSQEDKALPTLFITPVVSYLPLSSEKSKTCIKKWSRLSNLKCERSRIIRRLASTTSPSTATLSAKISGTRSEGEGNRKKEDEVEGGAVSTKVRRSALVSGTVAIIAQALEATRANFVARLEGQRLPSFSSPPAALPTSPSSLSPIGSPKDLFPQTQPPQPTARITMAHAQSIARRFLPLVGATVTIGAGVLDRENRAIVERQKKTASVGNNSIATAGCEASSKNGARREQTRQNKGGKIRLALVGREGVVIHETEKMACVALKKVQKKSDSNEKREAIQDAKRTNVFCPSSFAGRLVNVRKRNLRVL